MIIQANVVYGVPLEGGRADMSITVGRYGVSMTGGCYD